MTRLTLELPDDVAARLESIAAAQGRAAEDMAREAVTLFTVRAEAFEAFVAEGEADLAAGRVVPMEEVFAEAQAIIEKARQGAA